MEETTVHGSAVERAESTSVRVGQYGFGAIFVSDPAQAMRNFVESLVPGDAFKSGLIRWSDGMAGRGRPALHSLEQWSPLRLHPSHRIQHAIRRVHAVQILGDFGAKESAGNGVPGITLNLGGAAVFDGDQDAAG